MLRGLARLCVCAGSAALILALLATPAGGITLPTQSASTAPPTPVTSVKLDLPDVFMVKHHPVTVPRRHTRVTGVVRPYVPGQQVTIRAFIGKRVIKSTVVQIQPDGNGAYGRFSAVITTRRVGVITVYARHTATPTMGAFLTHRSYATLNEHVGFGATGRFVQLIQQRLAALHFYVPQTGVYDQGTGLAVDAYHRLLHWGTYQTLDRGTVSWLLDGLGSFKVRDPHDGKHAEGNLGTQLLALINGSQVYRIYPISSGKPSTPTVLGDFRVYSKVPGYLPDGMFFSNFFYGGYAIHGYDPAPDYPASHGCMRLPISDAVSVYNWLQIGNAVDVYY